MSDIGNSITDIEKTTSDLENSMSDIGNGLYLHFHIGKQDGETVPQEITAVWREATPAAIHPKRRRPRRWSNCSQSRPRQLFDLFKVVPSFFRISAGGASRATQRLAIVGQLRRPSSSVRVLHPIPGGQPVRPYIMSLHPRNTSHINVERCGEKTFVLIL